MAQLIVRELDAGYGKLVVLHRVSVSVSEGQFVAVLGPNGSGKSTLIKSIYGMADVYGGDISLDGESLRGVDTEALSRRRLAYVPQKSNVFTSMTIRENLLLATRQLPQSDTPQALTQAYEMFPILEERQRQRAGQLSGGERQMLAIAIAWISRPRLMLLDEPTAGLAPLYVANTFRLLRQLTQNGINLLVVEQNARSVLRWCDYGYVLREGQVVFEGRAAEILADPETAKDYLGISTVKNAQDPAEKRSG